MIPNPWKEPLPAIFGLKILLGFTIVRFVRPDFSLSITSIIRKTDSQHSGNVYKAE